MAKPVQGAPGFYHCECVVGRATGGSVFKKLFGQERNMAKTATKQKQLPYFARVRTAGPGRPKGSTTNRTKFIRAATDEDIRKGVLPISVMLHNMRWFHQKAEDLLMDILEAQKK